MQLGLLCFLQRKKKKRMGASGRLLCVSCFQAKKSQGCGKEQRRVPYSLHALLVLLQYPSFHLTVLRIQPLSPHTHIPLSPDSKPEHPPPPSTTNPRKVPVSSSARHSCLLPHPLLSHPNGSGTPVLNSPSPPSWPPLIEAGGLREAAHP